MFYLQRLKSLSNSRELSQGPKEKEIVSEELLSVCRCKLILYLRDLAIHSNSKPKENLQ